MNYRKPPAKDLIGTEVYRVGITSNDYITLSLYDDQHGVTTVALTSGGCTRLINLLQAALNEVQPVKDLNEN